MKERFLLLLLFYMTLVFVKTVFAAGGTSTQTKPTSTTSTQQSSPVRPVEKPTNQQNTTVQKNDLVSIQKEFDLLSDTNLTQMTLSQVKRIEEILELLKKLNPKDRRLNIYGEGEEGTCLRYPKVKERRWVLEIEELLKKPNPSNKAWKDDVKKRLDDLYKLLDYFLKVCGYKDAEGGLDPEVKKVAFGTNYERLLNQYKKIIGQK